MFLCVCVCDAKLNVRVYVKLRLEISNIQSIVRLLKIASKIEKWAEAKWKKKIAKEKKN